MSTNYLVRFNGVLLPSDQANTPNAVVERDASGNISVSAVGATSLSTSGPLLGGTVTLTGTASITTAGLVVQLDATSAGFTATLPPASSSSGQFLYVVKTDSSGNLPTIKGNASELINGANTYTGLSAQYNHALLYCNGTKWLIVG